MLRRRRADRDDDEEFESAEERGQRYLLEGRLTVAFVDGEFIGAICQGHRDIYHLGHEPRRGWWCTCPAEGLCPHLVALHLVTDLGATRRNGPNGRRTTVDDPPPRPDGARDSREAEPPAAPGGNFLPATLANSRPTVPH